MFAIGIGKGVSEIWVVTGATLAQKGNFYSVYFSQFDTELVHLIIYYFSISLFYFFVIPVHIRWCSCWEVVMATFNSTFQDSEQTATLCMFGKSTVKSESNSSLVEFEAGQSKIIHGTQIGKSKINFKNSLLLPVRPLYVTGLSNSFTISSYTFQSGFILSWLDV